MFTPTARGYKDHSSTPGRACPRSMRSSYRACLIGLICCCYGAVRVSASRSDGLTSSSSRLSSHSEYSSYDKKRDFKDAPEFSVGTLSDGDLEEVGVEFLGAHKLRELPDDVVLSIDDGGDNLLGYEGTHPIGKSKGRKRKKKNKNGRQNNSSKRDHKQKMKYLFGSTLVEPPHKRGLAPEDVNLRWNEEKNTWESTDTNNHLGRVDSPADRRYHPGTLTPAVDDAGTPRHDNPEALSTLDSRSLGDLPRQIDVPVKNNKNRVPIGTLRDGERSFGSYDTSVPGPEDELSATSENNQWKVFSSIRFDTYRAEDGSITTSKPIVTYGVRDEVPDTVHSYHAKNYRFNIPPQRESPDQGRSSPSRSQNPAFVDEPHDPRIRNDVRGFDGSLPDLVEQDLAKNTESSDFYGSINEGILRNRYWSRKNRQRNHSVTVPQTTQSLANDGIPFGVDNSSGNLMNPFDQILPRSNESPNDQPSQSRTTNSSRTQFDSNLNGIRNTGYNGGYSSDNHYSFTINSTLSTPHYYRALNNINKPITPYNWRRRKIPQSSVHHHIPTNVLPASTRADYFHSSHDSSLGDRGSSSVSQVGKTKSLNHNSRKVSSTPLTSSNSSDARGPTKDPKGRSHTVSSKSVFHRNARSFDADPVPSNTPHTTSSHNVSDKLDSQDSLNGSWISLRPSPYTQLQSSGAKQFSSNANPFQVNSTPVRYRSPVSQSSPQYPTRDNQPETTRRRFSPSTNMEDDGIPVRGSRARSSARLSERFSPSTNMEDDGIPVRDSRARSSARLSERFSASTNMEDDGIPVRGSRARSSARLSERFSASTNMEDDGIPVRDSRARSSARLSESHGETTLEDDSNGAGTRADEDVGAGEQPKRPNIVVIITDDLDVELGSLNYMPRLHAMLRRQGGLFPHSYTSTPMCCPSRSSLLTGMYIHNHEVYTNNDNCSSVRWQETHEQRTFATYLSRAGYNTGYFGKYLNKYKGPYTPAGWKDWMGLRLNSRYYNYTVYKNGQKIKYGDSYPRDYFPNVITNEGIRFLRENFDRQGGRPSQRPYTRGGGTFPPPSPPPLLMVLSYPAPHGPEDSAPEYSNMFFNATDHHTVAYDYAPNPDKQWILQYTGRMPPIKLKFTDLVMTKRLQTLQSVDQAIERIVTELRRLDQLSNTYIFFTSDHGYHLGQFGLIKGKSMPFEFDIKVPLMVRGPGVVPSTEFAEIALNVDLAPTFLDIGGVSPPPHMDGRSLLPLLTGRQGERRWRDSFLVESSGRHRDEDVLEMRAQKRFLQLTRLRDREVKLNSTLATVEATLAGLPPVWEADTNETIEDYMLPLLNTSLFASSMPGDVNESEYLSPPYFDNAFGSNQSEGSFEVDLAASLSSGGGSGLGDGERGHQVPLFTSKHEHLEEVCKSEQLQAPCDEHKKWRCEHDGTRWRLKKCRPRVQLRRAHCVCGPEMGMGYLVRLDQEERRRQRTFLRQHASQDLRSLSPKFLKAFVDVDSSEVARENLRHRHARKRNRAGRTSETSSDVSSPTRTTNEESNSVGSRTKRNRRDVGLESAFSNSSTPSATRRPSTSVTNPSSSGLPKTNLGPSERGATVYEPAETLGENETSYESPLPDSSSDHLDEMRRPMSTPSPEGHEQRAYPNEEEEEEDNGGEMGEAVSGVVLEDEDDLGGVPDLVHSYVEEEELKDIERQIHDIFDELNDLADASGNTTGYSVPHDNTTTIIQESAGGCVAVGGAVVDCPPLVYRDKHAWRSSKHAIDEEIRRLGHQMRLLKVIRQHLRESRPRKGNSPELYTDTDYDAEEGDEHEPTSGENIRESTRETASRNRNRGRNPDEDIARDPSPSSGMESNTWPHQTTGFEENSIDGRSSGGHSGRRGDGGRKRRPLTDNDSVVGGSSGRRGRPVSGAELVTEGELEDNVDETSPTTERVFGWMGYDVTESGNGVVTEMTTAAGGGGDVEEEGEMDPDHFTYTGGYRGNKGSQVAVYVPRDRSVCWCNKKAALQQHVRTEKLRKMLERQRLRELRAAMRLQRRKEKQRKRGQRQQKERPCNLSHQNCYHHDNDHWKTPPLWTDGSFCACLNAANNTYWCVRTVNSTHNTLYCEFITGLITYYDLNIDPYQLRNVAFMLDNDAVAELHDSLTALRSCRGVLQCDLVDNSRDGDPTDDGNGSVILPPSLSMPSAGTSPSSPFSDEEDLFTNEVTSAAVDAVTGLRVSLYGSDEHLNDTMEEEDEDGEVGGTQGYDVGTRSTPELDWDRLGLYHTINETVDESSSDLSAHPTSSVTSFDIRDDLITRNDPWLHGTPASHAANNEVTSSIADDIAQGRYFRTGRRNRTNAYKADRWALSTSTRNGSSFDVTDLPYDGEAVASQRLYLNSRRNGSGRGNSSRRGFKRFHVTNLEQGEFGALNTTGNGHHHRGVANRRSGVQGDIVPLPNERLASVRQNADLFSSGNREEQLEDALAEEGVMVEGRDGRRDGRPDSGPGRRRRPKKEQKKRRKEMRRLRKEQKRKRLDSLLWESSPDPVRALSGSSLTGVTRLPRRSREERRRLRRWRRFEKKLKQLTETGATEGAKEQ